MLSREEIARCRRGGLGELAKIALIVIGTAPVMIRSMA